MEKFKYSMDYELITLGKSWVFVNPSRGCPLGCGYCVEQKDNWFEFRVEELYNDEETLFHMYSSPLILKHRSPLTLFNYSDPLLSRNYKTLISILESLDGNGWTNKVGLISKFKPDDEKLERLASLKNLKLALYVSYSNFIDGIENKKLDNRPDLMKRAKEFGIPVIGYVRPLVREWLPIKNVLELADQTGEFVDGYVLSGMRLTDEIEETLTKNNIIVPKVPTRAGKKLDKEFASKVKYALRKKTDKPVFYHTSCAMSYLYGEPDYNSHDIREKLKFDECSFPCPIEQKDICYSRECKTSDGEIKGLIGRTGKDISFERDGNVIKLIGDNISQEDVSFLRHIIPEFVKK